MLNRLLLFVLCCLVGACWGQGELEYAINYTTKDGLPSNENYWLFQDHNGLIWVGGDAGLASFDGVHFETYDAPNAKNKAITGVFEDPSNRLWCHNFAGQIYYWWQDSLHLLEAWEKYASLAEITKLFLDKDILKINGRGTYWHYDLVTQQFNELSEEVFLLDRGQELYFDPSQGFQLVNQKESKPISCADCMFLLHKDYPKRKRLQSGNVVQKGQLTLFYVHNYYSKEWRNENGFVHDQKNVPFVFKLEQEELKAVHFPPLLAKYRANLVLNTIDIWNDTTLALSTSEGLFIWNINNNTVQHLFKEESVSDCLLDREQNVWVSTLEHGVFFVPMLSLRVHKSANPYPFKRIYELEKDKEGHLLLGYDDGSIIYWDSRQQKQIFEKNFPIRKRIYSIQYNSSKNEFLVGTSRTAYIFDPVERKLKQGGVIRGAIKDVDFDRLGNILLALGHGVQLYSTHFSNGNLVEWPDNWKQSIYWKAYRKEQDKERGLGYLLLAGEGTRTYSILAQHQPSYSIWVGTSTGLRHYKEGSFSLFYGEDQKNIIAKALETVNDTTIAVGSLNSGMYIIKNQRIIKHLTQKDGLPSNEVRQLKWSNGILWVSTRNGMVQYDWDKDTLVAWNANNAALWGEILDFALLEDKIYLTNGDKLMSAPIKSVSSTQKPTVNLLHFGVNDSIYPLQDFYELSYDENDIDLKFRGLSYKSQQNFVYQYRLLPLEEDWNVRSATNNRVNYPGLSSGNYTFEVLVKNPDGQLSTPIRLPFSIAQPIYAQTWFLILIGGAVLGLLVMVYRYQIARIERKNQEKLQRSHLERDIRISELKALKAQLNPHFIFNALNSIQDYIIQNERELASDYLGTFADLMRIYLHHSQEGTICLNEEIEALRLYLELEAVRLEDNFSYTIEQDPMLDLYQIEIPTMLVQPYVENAIKHGLFHKKGARNITIKFSCHSKQSVMVLIRDNGIGRAAAQQYQQQRKHPSFATSANNSRLELLNFGQTVPIKAEIIDLVHHGQALGTEVRVTIPIKNSLEEL